MSTPPPYLRGLALVGVLGFATPSHAATDTASPTPLATANSTPNGSRIAFSAAYLGELLLHPGLLVGAEYRLAPSAAASPRGPLLLLAGNVGSYVHVRNHVGVMADAELGFRYGFRSGWFADGFAGLGYLHTFLAAPVYEVDDAGHVEHVTDFGRPAFMQVLSAGGGFEKHGLAGFARFETFGQYPFNQHLLPHFALVLGVRVSSAGVSL